MNTLKLLELKTPVYFTEDVYIDKKFLLFTQASCFSDDVKRLLSDWQFTLLYTKGTVTEENPQEKENKNAEIIDFKRFFEGFIKKVFIRNYTKL